ncbi:FMN reductase [Streptomyces sp. SID10853]|uniref:FMN reductase n=1 Tax=Streptomyces sp. SID10853 TaxID=2706028 RepID=UPI0013C18B1C|nr:FMN reductase [Streptomyces sp. SID10853]NDZ81657.1 FMN reductase [Streptomyces sp. SID10853]
MTAVKLVAVSAGLGRPSSTRLLADRLTQATAGALDGRETEVRVVEIRDLATAIANHLVTGFPDPVLRDAIDAVTGADGLIAVTPVFTASYSGLFKSFFDLIDNTALAGTPVLVAATGGTARHSLVLEHAMRPLFGYLRAVVVPTAVYAASEDWGSDGDADGSLPDRIERAGRELAALMAGRPAADPVRTDGTSGDGALGEGASADSAHADSAHADRVHADRAHGDGLGADSLRADEDDIYANVVPFAQQLAGLRTD